MNKLFVFIKYLIKSIILDLCQIPTSLKKIFRSLFFPKPWVYLSLILFLVARIMGLVYADLFILSALVSYLWYLYDKGDWMYEYRQKYKDKIKQKED